MKLWLMVKPLAFNVVVYPGMTFNQLRWNTGPGAKLTHEEILQENERNPFLFEPDDEGKLVPSEMVFTDDPPLHMDTDGVMNHGIIGLRARKNPNPIDLRKGTLLEPKEESDNKSEHTREDPIAEDYFEPVMRGERIHRDERYITATREHIRVPSHLCMELKQQSRIGMFGTVHDAGFLDNGFEGLLMFELIPGEDRKLNEKIPLSKLEIFRTTAPSKLYGEKSGSHYHKQGRIKLAKWFTDFKFEYAAKNFKKLNRDVLVQEAEVLLNSRSMREGFEFIGKQRREVLVRDVLDGFFHSRYDCETDETVLQMISYTLLFGPKVNVFSYVRAEDIEDYGEPRLFGCHSLGVGGHINREDMGGSFGLEKAISREISEEVNIIGRMTDPILVGTMMHYESEVRTGSKT